MITETEKDYAPEFIKKLPGFVRWIIFLPSGLIAMTIVSIVNRWSMSNYLGIDPKSFSIEAWISYISTVVMILVCSVVAPKKQFLISLTVAILWCVYIGFTIAFLSLSSRLTWQYIVYAILNLLGAASVPYASFLMLLKKQDPVAYG